MNTPTDTMRLFVDRSIFNINFVKCSNIDFHSENVDNERSEDAHVIVVF